MMLHSTKLIISCEGSTSLKVRGVAGGRVEGAGEPNKVQRVCSRASSSNHHSVKENVARRLNLAQPIDTFISCWAELVIRTSWYTMKIITVCACSVGVILNITHLTGAACVICAAFYTPIGVSITHIVGTKSSTICVLCAATSVFILWDSTNGEIVRTN